MAKYTASPWGSLRGKLNGSVGGVWKGIEWARKLVLPRQLGTITNRNRSKESCIRGVIYAAKQMNIRRAIFTALGILGKDNLTTLIHPVWEWLCDKRKYKLTGINLFIKMNARRLWYSTWTGLGTGVTFDSNNLPDYTQMLVSDGDLEPTQAVTGATYVGGTGLTTITWNTATYGNGVPGDNTWLAIYVRPTAVQIADYRPSGNLYVKNTGQLRSVGTAVIAVPPNLAAANLTAFVFFNDTCANYSPSMSSTVS